MLVYIPLFLIFLMVFSHLQPIELATSFQNTSHYLPSHHARRTLERRIQYSDCTDIERFRLSLVVDELLRWSFAAATTIKPLSRDRQLNAARASTFRSSFAMSVRNRDAEQIGWRYVGLILELFDEPHYRQFRITQNINPEGRIRLRCGRAGPTCPEDRYSIVFDRANTVMLAS